MGVSQLFRGAGPEFTELGFEYSIRRSERAKNLRITVGDDGVVVVLPRRCSERAAIDFLIERRAWILRALDRVERSRDAIAARSLAHGSCVPYLGRDLTLQIVPGGSGRVKWSDGADELFVHSRHADREYVAALLERWYRRQARSEIALRLDAAVARNGTAYKRLAIRNQRTRWGSCSSSGTLSFNWRLMLAPEAILDYVVEHEAAHIEVADHSRRFWALLDQRLPDWRNARRWLRDNGGSLQLV